MKNFDGGHVVRNVSLAILCIAATARCDAGEVGSSGTGGATGSSGTGTKSATSGASSGSATGSSGSSSTSSSSGAVASTCVGSTGVSAPNGYHVVGNLICDSNNTAHLFHGIARPSLEWSDTGQNISQSDFQLMRNTWNANVVRISMNENYWLQNSSGYQTTIDNVIQWAHQASLDVILDLHWSGSPFPGAQQEMADQNSITFWSQVATKYKGDGRVLFELYNEPQAITWDVWLNGNATYVGMQQLYDAVHATGANNVVIVGGVDWAYDLSGVPTTPVKGTNVAYATHPYAQDAEKAATFWDTYWGKTAAQFPVIVTEFGTLDCTTTYYSDLMTYADQHNAGWTAWAWWVSGCAFPSIINDWSGTPNAPGMLIQAKLKAYP